jgi:MIP family channel proteins
VYKQSAPKQFGRPQKLLAELAGTFAVVLVGAGAVCADAYLRSTQRSGLGPLGIAVAYGIIYAVAVAALGRISGGHFNPAVTIGHWVTRRFGPFDTLAYCAAQLVGAAAAAYLLRAALPERVSSAAMLGTPRLAAGLTQGPAMLIEAAMTFVLVLGLWITTVDRPRPRYWLAGLCSGAVIAAAVHAGGPHTGGAMNPARAFGPALAAHQWAYQPVYWIGPLAGGVAAASLYDLIFHRTPARSLPEKTPRENHSLTGY